MSPLFILYVRNNSYPLLKIILYFKVSYIVSLINNQIICRPNLPIHGPSLKSNRGSQQRNYLFIWLHEKIKYFPSCLKISFCVIKALLAKSIRSPCKLCVWTSFYTVWKIDSFLRLSESVLKSSNRIWLFNRFIQLFISFILYRNENYAISKCYLACGHRLSSLSCYRCSRW